MNEDEASIRNKEAIEVLTPVIADEVANLNFEDLIQRRALAVKDAVETEITLSRNMRETVEVVDSLTSRIKEDLARIATGVVSKEDFEEMDIHGRLAVLEKASVRMARCISSYAKLAPNNTESLVHLESMIARLSSSTDEETIKKLLRTYVANSKRKKASLAEIKAGALSKTPRRVGSESDD